MHEGDKPKSRNYLVSLMTEIERKQSEARRVGSDAKRLAHIRQEIDKLKGEVYKERLLAIARQQQ